jgi:hypothetical protein
MFRGKVERRSRVEAARTAAQTIRNANLRRSGEGRQ